MNKNMFHDLCQFAQEKAIKDHLKNYCWADWNRGQISKEIAREILEENYTLRYDDFGNVK